MSVPIYLSNHPFNPPIHPLQITTYPYVHPAIHSCILFLVGQIESQMHEAVSHVKFIPMGPKHNA